MNRGQLCWSCHAPSITLCSAMLWEWSGVRAWAAPKNCNADNPTRMLYLWDSVVPDSIHNPIFSTVLPCVAYMSSPTDECCYSSTPVTVPATLLLSAFPSAWDCMDLSQAEIPQPWTYKLQGPFCPVLISGSKSIRSHNCLRETGCQTCSRGYFPESSFCWFIPYWHCWLPVNAWPGNINYNIGWQGYTLSNNNSGSCGFLAQKHIPFALAQWAHPWGLLMMGLSLTSVGLVYSDMGTAMLTPQAQRQHSDHYSLWGEWVIAKDSVPNVFILSTSL